MRLLTIIAISLILLSFPTAGPTSGQTWDEFLNQANALAKEDKNDSALVIGYLALAEAEESLGTEDTAVAHILHRLAKYNLDMFECSKAEPLLKRAITIREKTMGADDFGLVKSLIRLGVVYLWQGKYGLAESLYKRALSIAENTLGANDPEVGESLHGLSMLYFKWGKFNNAEAAIRRALAICENDEDPKQQRMVPFYLTTLANIHCEQGRYSDAETLYLEVLDIYEKALGPEHLNVVITLCNLADNYATRGELERAVQFYLRALAIQEKAPDPDGGFAGRIMAGLAELYTRQGRYAEAESFYNRAIAIKENTPGGDLAPLADYLKGFAMLCRLQGKMRQALEVTERANHIMQKNFHDNATMISEKTALGYSRYLRHSLDCYLSCFFELESTGSDALKTTADIILSNKGQVSDRIFERRRALVSETDSTTLALAATFKATRLRLSKLFVRGSGPDSTQFRHKTDSLTQLIDDLESDLAHRSASFRNQMNYENISFDRIQSLLPDNSVLIEYIKYKYVHLRGDTSLPKYLALAINNEGPPVIVDLGPASELDSVIYAYRRHMLSMSQQSHMPSQKDKETYGELAGELYFQTLAPIADNLTGKRLVILSPDCGLNLISFAGLVDDNGHYLIEKIPVHYLSAGREMIRLEERLPAGKGLLAIGDPDYDASVEARRRESKNNWSAARDETPSLSGLRSGYDFFNGSGLKKLPGTRREIQLILDRWRKVSPEPAVAYFGYQASEDNFKAEAPGKRAIHLATHGYFLRRSGRISPDAAENSEVDFSLVENPLLQSGLFFAGANLRGEGTDDAGLEDGILTAHEVSAMNLRGTELAVLSACETGLGEVLHGEGVYGLRRALRMAGVRTIISALWSIPDNETAAFTNEIYELSDETLPEKLRRIQLGRINYLRANQLADHPYSWGAFIALGAWN